MGALINGTILNDNGLGPSPKLAPFQWLLYRIYRSEERVWEAVSNKAKELMKFHFEELGLISKIFA